MAFFRTLLLTTIVFLSGCITETNIRPTQTELLAGTNRNGKVWKINNINIGFGTVTPFACLTDNNITYYPDGRYEINEGLSKCDRDDPPGLLGTWEFVSDDLLVITLGDSTQVWNIESLSSNRHNIGSSFNEGYRTYTLVSSN